MTLATVAQAQLAYRLDIGSEWLLLAQMPDPQREPTGFGRVDGQLMPQYVQLYRLNDHNQQRWLRLQQADGQWLVMALLAKSQWTQLSHAVALALQGGRRLVFALRDCRLSDTPALAQLLATASVRRALDQLAPLDRQAFDVALSAGDLSPNGASIEGMIDSVRDGMLKGWALDRNDEPQVQAVHVRDETGLLVAFGETGLARPDLALLGVSDQLAGFRLPLSPRVLDGLQHTLRLQVGDDASSDAFDPFVFADQTPVNSGIMLMDLPASLNVVKSTFSGDALVSNSLCLQMEKLFVAIELGLPEAKGLLAVFFGVDGALDWLMEIRRAEIALAMQRFDKAMQHLNRAEQTCGQYQHHVKHAKRILQLNSGGLQAAV